MSATSLKQFIKSSFWILFASFVVRFAGFIVLPSLARILEPMGLGIYSILQQTIQTGDILSRLGLDVAIHRNGAQYQTLGLEKTGRTFGVGGLIIAGAGIAIALFFWSQPAYIAVKLLGEPRTEAWLGLAAIAILLTVLANPSWFYLMALHAFRTFSTRTTIITIVGAAAALILTANFGLSGAIWSLVVTALLQLIVGWWLTLPILKAKQIRLRCDRFVPEAVSMFRFGLPFYASNFVASFVALPFLGYVSKLSGVEQVGYIRIAQSLSQLVAFLPGAIAPVLISTLSASLVADPENHIKMKSLHFRGLWILILALTIAICLSLDLVVPILFGNSYLPSIWLARVAVWSTAISSISGMFNQYLVAEGKTRVIGIVQTIAISLNVLLALILIPLCQDIGLSALGLLLAQAIAALFCLLYLARPALQDIYEIYTPQLRSIGLISAFASLTIFLIPYAFKLIWLKLVLGITIGCIILGLAIWQTFTKAELNIVKVQFKAKIYHLLINLKIIKSKN